MEGPLIVNVNSMKGGAGKTTIALAIALAGLRRYSDQELPVVLIDADIFGTEVADLLLPGSGCGRWSLALLDLLVQSTGGGVTVARLIEQRLRQAVKDQTSLPFAKPPGLPPLLVIPSLAARSPAERLELLAPVNGQPRLDTSLVAESFGRVQLELRLTALVDTILDVVQPRLLILDHAPFHFPLSTVPRLWAKDEELKRLLLDSGAGKRWQGRQIRHLEVAGADQQDLLRFLAMLGDSDRRTKAHADGTRWVLNRDLHHHGDSSLDSCNCRRLLPHLVQGWPQLGHVLLQPQLLAGLHGRNLAGITYEQAQQRFTVEHHQQAVSSLELLAAAAERNQLDPLVFDPGKQRFKPQGWLELLA